MMEPKVNRIKLTPTQLNVLFEMRNKGSRILGIDGLNTHWFLHGSMEMVRFTTILKLANLGLIKEIDDFKRDYILTDKGKAYLDEITK